MFLAYLEFLGCVALTALVLGWILFLFRVLLWLWDAK